MLAIKKANLRYIFIDCAIICGIIYYDFLLHDCAIICGTTIIIKINFRGNKKKVKKQSGAKQSLHWLTNRSN